MRAPRTKDNSLDPTGEFPLGVPTYLFYLLFQVARQRDVHYDRKLSAAGISLHRWRIIAVIRRIENCSMKDLALFSAVDRTTLTRAVDQLVAEELVERWSSPRDRRRVNLSLTPKGEAVHGQATRALQHGNEAMLEGVDEDALRGAARLLQQVIRNVVEDPLIANRLLAYGQSAAKSD
ncbi:MAG: MarR family transcriptional regulator [Alphaproteobacteria bacterium]|nr:MarR family transcriptional regulator [Alphaproteobacteria bacterium]MBU2305317.1 MarR family transcriptional regulator [Alphaproteobacteria bacterium]